MCAPAVPKLTFLSSVLRFSFNCAVTVPKLVCPTHASTVLQLHAPTVPESFQFCAPAVPSKITEIPFKGAGVLKLVDHENRFYDAF